MKGILDIQRKIRLGRHKRHLEPPFSKRTFKKKSKKKKRDKEWGTLETKNKVKKKLKKRLQRLEEYASYLQTPHWKGIKERIGSLRKNCEACSSSNNLNVHHGTYIRKGREKDEDLFLVCENCHNRIHELYKRMKEDLKRTGKRWLLMEATRTIIRETRG